MAISLLCLLEGLLGLALVCLVLVAFWWILTTLLSALGVALDTRVLAVLKVIGVLIVLILVIRAVLLGEVCGWFGLARVR